MCSYSQLPRRKIGLLTLAAACLLVAGWGRTSSIDDTVFLYGIVDGDSEYLISTEGKIGWVTINYGRRRQNDEVIHTPRDKFFDKFGFEDSARYLKRSDLKSFTIVPYWSIVMPLTLLSAYLLLSKPRSAGKSHLDIFLQFLTLSDAMDAE